MEEGDDLGSIPFARRLEQLGNQRLAFVIGGADGLTTELKALCPLAIEPVADDLPPRTGCA